MSKQGQIRDGDGVVYPIELALGQPDDAEEDSPSADASLIALTKGILAALAGVSTINITAAVQDRGLVTDRSGSISVAATSQQLMAANPARKYMQIHNADPTEDMWINFTSNANADQPSFRIAAKQTMTWDGAFIPTDKITVIATTLAHKYTAKEA